MSGATMRESLGTPAGGGAVGRPWRAVWRAMACAAVWAISAMLTGGLMAAFGLEMEEFAAQVPPRTLFGLQALAALGLAAAIAPLAMRLQGSFTARWLALFGFIWVAVGVCNGIETEVFTTLGKWHTTTLAMLVPSLVFTAAMAGLFAGGGGADPATAAGLGGRGIGSWLWRAPLALLSFPLAYYVFGMLLMAVCPYLMEYYTRGVAWLRMPDPALLPLVQLGRSVLFVLSTLPILALWRGRRGMLMLQLGLASWVVVGAFGMIQAAWMPLALRIPHTLEILADSMAWAWMIVGLLVPKRAAA